MIKETKVKMKLLDIKNLYDFCSSMYHAEGLNAKFSYLIFKNEEMLKTPAQQIIQGIYDPENDPDFQKFREKQSKIIMKYADRNTSGEIIYNEDGSPKITEMIVEFQRENEKLVEENTLLLKKTEEKSKANMPFLEQEVEISLYKITLDSIPNTVPPYIVGQLALVND